MVRKYELTKNKKEWLGHTLFKIKALIDIERFGVKKGDLGGWIEKEENLNQDGNAWVSGNAWVYGDARVSDNAWVYGNARVYGDAWVSDNAWVYGNAWVSGNVWVYGKIKLTSVLCLKFNFEFDWQVKLWQKKEKEYEAEVYKRLKVKR